MPFRKTAVQQAPYSIYFEPNKVATTIANLAKKNNVPPHVYMKGIFIAMLEIVDPHKQFFNTLHMESYRNSGPAISYFLNSSSREHCVLCIHEPRVIENIGIFENHLLVKTYINLVILYLFKIENPQTILLNTPEFIAEIEGRMKDAIFYDSDKHTVKITIPNNRLMTLFDHQAVHLAVQIYRARDPKHTLSRNALSCIIN